MSNTKSNSNGIGIGTILFVVFLVLKLTGVITWSWWWVTAPLWAPAVVIVVMLGLSALIIKAADRP
ncbi:hypothetical protein [Mycobacterium aquaticum]|uniref:Transmembrane Fragile-X-F protein n=1 Tax=Mycobacterium aquaticum TaxID=1927124 RepID=A0A1X0A0F4_9MYCO|nr:hypothetical protein [Mycobacterium aquaticum]ORA23422.1 hypothetical protein BST13_35310 [Mycobacterium aquaticum]